MFFELNRDMVAQLVAAHTSGKVNAIPEEEDWVVADKVLDLLETEIKAMTTSENRTTWTDPKLRPRPLPDEG